jgi:flavodoxin
MASRDKRYLVTYFSRSGSTRKVAEAIFEALPEPKAIHPLDEVDGEGDYDLTFVGFPLWDLGPAPAAAEFLRRYCGASRIAVFYTQGNIPDFWQDRELEGRLHGLCRSGIVDRFACQGEVPDETIQMMEVTPAMAEFARQAEQTKGQPDERALARARDFARRLASEF